MSNGVAASIKNRLKNKADEGGVPFEFFLVRYACERFLYRLGASPARDRCILKGATLLAIWMEEPYRATRDVDLLAAGDADEGSVRAIMETICNVPCSEDGLTFDLNSLRTSSISGQTHPGRRVKLNCYLGKARIPTHVDFGFGDVVTSGSEEAQMPTLIEGVPAPSLRVYPRAASVAEKFEAMVQLELRNSRMKDFHDVWALSEEFAFEGPELREAIRGCFEQRGTVWTSKTPPALTSAFYSRTQQITWWNNYCRKEFMTPPPTAFEVVGGRMLRFLAPIRESILADTPFNLHWHAGGPWWYKDSGVEWLGEIPAHWDVKRLKYAATLNPAPTEARNHGESLEVSFVPMEAVGEYGGLELTTTKLLGEVYTGYTYFREGDVVVAKITPCFENGKGAVATGLVNEIAFGTTELHVLRVKESMDRQFLFYLSMGDAFRKLGQAEMYGAGGQKRVPDSFIRDLRHPLPPLLEQRAIAAFLDRETAEIDTLVAKKERLVELLQEKRTALISHAVTKGLDPDVPLKDSGVEWLGEIPAHWNCLSIARVTLSRCDGPFGSNLKSQHYSDNGVRVIRLQNIGAPDFLDSDQVYIEATHARTLGDHSVLKGDLLVAGLGDDAHPVGRACVAPAGLDQAIVKADCFRFRIDQKKALSEFAAYQLSATALAAAGYFVTGSTRLRMNLTTTAAKKIALPPLPEQRTIAAFLDRETAQIDGLVAKVRGAIDRLKELRTALISAAVTGKIDVREAAA